MFLTGRRRASSVPDAFNNFLSESATRGAVKETRPLSDSSSLSAHTWRKVTASSRPKVPPAAGGALDLNPDLLSSRAIVSLALAPSEICCRCGESATSLDLKASIAARAFPLRYSEDDEGKISWESLW